MYVKLALPGSSPVSGPRFLLWRRVGPSIEVFPVVVARELSRATGLGDKQPGKAVQRGSEVVNEVSDDHAPLDGRFLVDDGNDGMLPQLSRLSHP